MAERVLLHVEEPGRLRCADRLERVQERSAADEERRRDADIRVDLGQELERLAARLGIERLFVEREVRALGEERERLTDGRGLGVVADEDRRHARLPGEQAAVDGVGRAGDERGLVRREEGDDGRNLLGAAHPS